MALTTTPTEFGFGSDPVVIRSLVDTIKGGVVLDVTDFPDEYIRAGHLIIRDTETKKTYKPMPVSNGQYASLPQGYEYCGVLISSIPTAEAFAAVLTIGEVNDKCLTYTPTAAIAAAFKSAVPTIVWAHD